MRQKTTHRRHNQNAWKSSPLCCTTGMSINSAMNESEAPPLLKRNLSLHDHRASIAAESGTHDLHNRDIGHQSNAQQLRDLCSFLPVEPQAVVETQRACQRLCQGCNCGSSTVFHSFARTIRRPPCQCTAGRNTGTDHGICLCATTEVATTYPQRLRTWRCTITGMSTSSKNCKQPRLCMSTGTSTAPAQPGSALPRRVPLGATRPRAVPPRAERRVREQRPDLTRVVVNPSARAIS